MSRLLRPLVIALGVATVAPAGLAGPPDPWIEPYLQNATPNAITVMWESLDPLKGAVELQGREGAPTRRFVEAAARTIHEVRITGLKPGTKYTYVVTSGRRRLPAATFRTLPPAGSDSWKIGIYGDNRSRPKRHAQVVRRMIELKPDLVLNSGDLVATASVKGQWKRHYFDPMRGLSERVPIFTCLGNHDTNSPNYYRYIQAPTGSGSEDYYSFRVGNARVIVLNSNRDFGYKADSKQTKWLERELAATRDARWTIVMFHHPLFRSFRRRGIEPMRWTWQPLFQKYGVDLVVTGHDHHYQRTLPIGPVDGHGVVHVVSGGGGAGLYRATPELHTAAVKVTHHVILLEASGDTIRGRAVDAKGKTFDRWTMRKGAVPKPDARMSWEGYVLKQAIAVRLRKPWPLREAGGRLASQGELTLANPFRTPIRLRSALVGGGAWTFEQRVAERVVRPGETIAINLAGSAPVGRAAPVPHLVLTVLRDDGAAAPFLNDRLVFRPFGSPKSGAITASSSTEPMRIDGRLEEPVWASAAPAGPLVRHHAMSAPKSGLELKVVHRRGKLLVSGVRRAPAAPGEAVYVQLTAGRRRKMVRIAPGADPAVTKRRRKVKLAVHRTAEGWAFELAMPLPRGRKARRALRLNVQHVEPHERRASLLSLGDFGPEFTGDGPYPASKGSPRLPPGPRLRLH